MSAGSALTEASSFAAKSERASSSASSPSRAVAATPLPWPTAEGRMLCARKAVPAVALGDGSLRHFLSAKHAAARVARRVESCAAATAAAAASTAGNRRMLL